MKYYRYPLLLVPILLFSSCSNNSGEKDKPEPKPEPVLSGIKIVTPPSKVDYEVGDLFNPEGVVIKEVFDNGQIGEVVNDYTYSPDTPLTIEDKEIAFSYKTFMAKQSITVSIKDDNTYASAIKQFENGRTYLEVDGYPYTIRGAQLRVDGLLNRSPNRTDAPPALSYDEMEKYFIAAKNAGINTIGLALQWSNVEISKDKYDFSLVDALLTHCNKHDLKCEFLWFGTNMCGDSRSYPIPQYIWSDSITYPQLESKSGDYSDMYGYRFYLRLDNPNYLAREEKVIKELMNHIYEWNKNNEDKKPLIGVQIHNEADGLVRWRRDQREIKLNGELIPYKTLWDMTLTALNNAGNAFKSSKYKLYTRSNITTSYGIEEFPQCAGTGISPMDVLHLDGIDIIGDDPYVTSPSTINKTIRNYRVENNYPHIAENMGNYSNSASMFLTAFQAGGSYIFYDLATPEYFIYLNGGGSYQMDQGIYNPDLSLKPHSQKTFDIVKAIGAMDGELARIESENFAAFNVDATEPVENRSQTINTTNVSFTFETNNGAIGFAIEDGNYIYLGANKESSIRLNNIEYLPYAEVGHFEKGEYITEEKVYPTDKVFLQPAKLYRIKITKILNPVESTTNDNV